MYLLRIFITATLLVSLLLSNASAEDIFGTWAITLPDHQAAWLRVKKSDSNENEIINKKKEFTSTSGQLLMLKGVEERPDPTQKTIDLLANLKRPRGLPESIGFKNVRDGIAEWTFFADGRYPFTRDGEIDVGRVDVRN